jgi:lysophospholipase L1-like esterase
VTSRPEQPEPFIRGAAYPAAADVPYPRASPTDSARLPADVWHAASVPVGVRIELVGDAQAIDIAYRTSSGNLGYRGDGAGITFSVWRGGRKVCEEEAVLGDGLIRLILGTSPPENPAIIYLPEGMLPLVQSLTAVKGEIVPAPALPRWLAYGDWTTQGWIASGPARGWAAIAARKAGLNLVNMGYASAGRGEIVSAEQIAGLGAEVISISYGESCWSRIPNSIGLFTEGFQAFLDVVRQGHPKTPVVIVSPVLRPDAEDVPNKLGATLADIRQAIESVTTERIAAGDARLSLVPGAAIIDADHLADGIHPGDEGHKRIAATVSKALNAAMKSAGEVAEADAAPTLALALAPVPVADGTPVEAPDPVAVEVPVEAPDPVTVEATIPVPVAAEVEGPVPVAASAPDTEEVAVSAPSETPDPPAPATDPEPDTDEDPETAEIPDTDAPPETAEILNTDGAPETAPVLDTAPVGAFVEATLFDLDPVLDAESAFDVDPPADEDPAPDEKPGIDEDPSDTGDEYRDDNDRASASSVS